MRSFGEAALVLLCVACAACSGRGTSGDAMRPDGATPGDGAAPTDGAVPHDGAATDLGTPADGGTPSDGASGDAATSPEVCTGGVDEDGDTRVDCDDDDCFSEPDCAAAHVARTLPGLTPCGDALVRTTTDTAADCAMVPMPMGSSYPLVCGGEVTIEATIRFFCGTDHGAAWVMEKLVLPRTMTMVTPRIFDLVEYDRAPVLDWEEHVSGASTTSGPTTMPLYDVLGSDAMGRTTATVVTVRSVQHGDRITRLLGLDQVMSHLDLDMPMSMDTHHPENVGATRFTVPP